MAPDTLIVITRSAESSIDTRNLVPAGVAFLAAVIAGASAWWGTRNQTRVSEKGIEAQEAISKAALVAQRELAEDGAIRQAELGRLDRVVQSRREWMNKLRDAVSEYEGQASYVYDWTAHHWGNDADMHAAQREAMRLSTYIGLLLDPNKPEHDALLTALGAVAAWVSNPASLSGPPIATEPPYLLAARRYANFPTALAALDGQVRELLEEAWGKVNAGE